MYGTDLLAGFGVVRSSLEWCCKVWLGTDLVERSSEIFFSRVGLGDVIYGFTGMVSYGEVRSCFVR